MTQSATAANDQLQDGYQSLRFVLRRGRAVRLGGSLLVATILGWVGIRTGWWELGAIGLAAGVAVNFVLKVAFDVLALVADTLLPQ